jgi:5-methylcytosine-specific restriction protein A
MARQFTRKTNSLAWQRCGGCCEGSLPDGSRCGAPLVTGHINYDHRDPYEFSHDSSLENCQVLCDPCDDAKTFERDIPDIRKSDRIRDKHVGAFETRHKLPCGRRSNRSRTMRGRVVERLTLGQHLERLGLVERA